MERLSFYCKKCNIPFISEGYSNPIYFADKVENCPECGSKTWPDWEKSYRMLKEYVEEGR